MSRSQRHIHRQTGRADLFERPGAKRALRTVLALVVGGGLAWPVVPAFASGGTTTGADVQVSGSASTGSPSVGAPLTYTFQVKNVGPDTATSTALTQTLPAGFFYGGSLISGTSPCNAAFDTSGNTVVTCQLGDMAKSTQVTVTVDVDAPSTAGTYPSTITANSTALDPNTANNQVTITVGVLASTSGGGGGGGGGSTTTGAICGTFSPDANAFNGYYGSGGVRVGGTFTNCGTIKQEVIDVYFTDTTTDPACIINVGPYGSKFLNAGSTQTILGGFSSSLSSSCTTMVLSHTFSVDVVADGVDQGSFLWSTPI